jgi:hypothetical protein
VRLLAVTGPGMNAQEVPAMPLISNHADVRTHHRARGTVIPGSRLTLPLKGAVMADKSPRQHMSKKAGKSLKEKRAEKHLKAEAKNKTQIVPQGKQH